MYDLVDRPVQNLCRSGRFLLWGMRGWAHAIARGTCPPVALARGFAGVDALSALPDFHIAMAMFNRDALEPIALAPMNASMICEDEAILIGLWRDASLGRLLPLRAMLELLCMEDTLAPIERAMTTATQRLSEAGLAFGESAIEPHSETK